MQDVPIKQIAVTLVTGFGLFLLLCLIGVALKWAIQTALEKKFQKPFWPDFISEAFTVVIMIVFSIYTAPYMGFGPNPLLK